MVVVQDLVEQLLPVNYEQFVERVHASVGEKRVTEAKDTLEAPVVQCSGVGAPVSVAGTVGVESGPEMRPEGTDVEETAPNLYSRRV